MKRTKQIKDDKNSSRSFNVAVTSNGLWPRSRRCFPDLLLSSISVVVSRPGVFSGWFLGAPNQEIAEAPRPARDHSPLVQEYFDFTLSLLGILCSIAWTSIVWEGLAGAL